MDDILQWLREHVRRYLNRPLVRPWALAVPVLVLVICLPLLRPLRHPGQISDDERLRIETVRALVEDRTLALPQRADLPDSDLIVARGQERFAAQAPMMSVLLALPAWVMHRMGLSFQNNHLLITYLLTLIGVTLPVAGAAGLVYRMGRVFELPRLWRMALSAVCVLGSGLLSYAVVLNPHAPAAVLLLCSAACLIHIAQLDREHARRALMWFALAGFAAALASTIDPAAAMLGSLFIFVIAAMRFAVGTRVLGIALFLCGAIAPVVVHDMLNDRITGDIFPAAFHQELRRNHAPGSLATHEPMPFDDPGDVARASWVNALAARARWTFTALLGSHGLFSHFPVVILGIAGVGAVMHRHWLPSTKTLAATTLVGAATIVSMYAIFRADWRDAMFAARWFIVFTPLLVFWAGAWAATRALARAGWSIAGALAAISVVVTMIGATDPYPPAGFDRYTVAGAIRRMVALHAVESSAADPIATATQPPLGQP